MVRGVLLPLMRRWLGRPYLGMAYFGVRAQVPPVGGVPCAPLLCGGSLGFLKDFWCALLQPSGTCLAPRSAVPLSRRRLCQEGGLWLIGPPGGLCYLGFQITLIAHLLRSAYLLPPDRGPRYSESPCLRSLPEGCGLPFPCLAAGDMDACIHPHPPAIYLSFH